MEPLGLFGNLELIFVDDGVNYVIVIWVSQIVKVFDVIPLCYSSFPKI